MFCKTAYEMSEITNGVSLSFQIQERQEQVVLPEVEILNDLPVYNRPINNKHPSLPCSLFYLLASPLSV